MTNMSAGRSCPKKMYMEAPGNKPSQDKSDLSGYQIEQTALGEETINGVVMNKSKIIMTGNDGTKMGGFMWTTKEGILAKIDALAVEKGQKARFKMEQTNIKSANNRPSCSKFPTDLKSWTWAAWDGYAERDDGALRRRS